MVLVIKRVRSTSGRIEGVEVIGLYVGVEFVVDVFEGVGYCSKSGSRVFLFGFYSDVER